MKGGGAGKRQYLNASFWAEFFLAFGFKTPGFHGLKEVDAADVTLSDEYWEVMGVCNSENPTIRSEDPMCDFHTNLKDITEPNLIALFHASVHSRLVTLKMAYKMQMSLGRLCGRLEVPKRFLATWKAVSEKFDSVLTWPWQQKESQDSFVDRSIWVQTNHEAVFTMVSKADFDACERACADKMDCPGDALQSMLRTSLGQALFHKEARQYQMNSFIDRCHRRADDLMHNGFTDETVQGYHDAADVECTNLAASGAQDVWRYPAAEFLLEFQGERIPNLRVRLEGLDLGRRRSLRGDLQRAAAATSLGEGAVGEQALAALRHDGCGA